MSGQAYYYSLMQPVERETYHALLIGLLNLAPSIRIPRLNGDQLGTLFFQLRLDHPEIFYAVGYSCRAPKSARVADIATDASIALFIRRVPVVSLQVCRHNTIK